MSSYVSGLRGARRVRGREGGGGFLNHGYAGMGQYGRGGVGWWEHECPIPGVEEDMTEAYSQLLLPLSPIHLSFAYLPQDHPNRRPHRDPHRARCLRHLVLLQHLLHPRPRRRRHRRDRRPRLRLEGRDRGGVCLVYRADARGVPGGEAAQHDPGRRR